MKRDKAGMAITHALLVACASFRCASAALGAEAAVATDPLPAWTVEAHAAALLDDRPVRLVLRGVRGRGVAASSDGEREDDLSLWFAGGDGGVAAPEPDRLLWRMTQQLRCGTCPATSRYFINLAPRADGHVWLSVLWRGTARFGAHYRVEIYDIGLADVLHSPVTRVLAGVEVSATEEPLAALQRWPRRDPDDWPDKVAMLATESVVQLRITSEGGAMTAVEYDIARREWFSMPFPGSRIEPIDPEPVPLPLDDSFWKRQGKPQ